MTRIDLLCRERVVAASLLERRGDVLAIRGGSLHPGVADLPGRSDTLDYFCLLLAQLSGCSLLDFGLSRPHLEDGVFRYKSKWRTRLVSAGGLKADIRIALLRRSEATLAFLRRNLFLQRAGDRFFARVLHDRSTGPDRLARLTALRESSGLAGIQLAYDPAEAEPEPAPGCGLYPSPISEPDDPFGIVTTSR